MALKKTIVTDAGIEVVDAYNRVINPQIQNKKNLSFTVTSHKDAEYSAFAAYAYFCDYDIDGENPYKQAYDHLKTLEQFAGAVDC